MDWTGLEGLRLWLLVISALDELGSARTYLTEQIRVVSGEMGIMSWAGIVQKIGEVAWVDARFHVMGALLEQQVFFDPSLIPVDF